MQVPVRQKEKVTEKPTPPGLHISKPCLG